MTAHTAVLIEDEADQVRRITRLLNDVGFEVTAFRDASEALRGAPAITPPIDLVVVDRRLPSSPTSEPDDSVGDALLERLLTLMPDSPFVVFTAHADVPHVQQATGERGQVMLTSAIVFDRVRHFEKVNVIGFEAYAKRIADALDSLAELEVDGLGPSVSDLDRRVLRKVTLQYGGTSARARQLHGGLTSASVYALEVRSASGVSSANVIVKTTAKSPSMNEGGFHTVLPASRVAAPGGSARGMCGGRRGHVFQLVGSDPTSLFVLIMDDDERACTVFGDFIRVVDESIGGVDAVRSLAELTSEFLEWDAIRSTVESLGLQCPSEGLQIRTSWAAQHGDLHPGNLLLDAELLVAIDFDSECEAPRSLDPLRMLLGGIFHVDSPFRGSGWPRVEQVAQLGSSGFAEGSSSPLWAEKANAWLSARSSGERELWGLVLGFACLQLTYDDVVNDPELHTLGQEFVRHAVARLSY